MGTSETVSGRCRAKALALALAALTPVALGLWAVGQLFLTFGPGTACTSEPECGSGTTSCGLCRPVVVAGVVWTVAQIGLVVGLVLWIATRSVPSQALAPAVAWYAGSSVIVGVVILVAEQVALDA